jgi:hypothetical protein
MRPDLWLAFIAATLVIGLIPGPGVAAILGYAIGSGRRTAFASVGGLMIGNLAASTASLLGMAASPGGGGVCCGDDAAHPRVRVGQADGRMGDIQCHLGWAGWGLQGATRLARVCADEVCGHDERPAA